MGSNYPKLTPTFPVGLFPPLLQCFEKVRCIRPSPNSLEPSLSACSPLRHSCSRWFGEVEPPQTPSNLPVGEVETHTHTHTHKQVVYMSRQ